MNEEPVTASAGAATYAERMQRIMDAVELRQPDRVPVAFFNMFWLARYRPPTHLPAHFNY